MDGDEPAGKAKRGAGRRGEVRLGTDEESAARIREAIKASLARAQGELVQLEGAGQPSPAELETEPAATLAVETDETVSVDAEVDHQDRPTEGEAFGPLLREAREQRGISLDQAATETRIARRYLEALEDGAPAERFPSRPYARFFLRDYGRYLGVEDGSLHDAYRAGDDDADEEFEPPSVAGSPPRRRWAKLAIAAAVIAAVVLLGVTRIGSPSREPLPAARSSPTTRVAAAPSSPSPMPTATRATQIVAVLQMNESSWVEAVTDGESTLQKLLPTNSVQRLKANETLQLLLGNAGGVRLTVNGERVPTGSDASVLRLSFALRDGRVVTEVQGA